jgi:uncharacterized protein YegP (UPF0339 family)
MLFFSLHKSKIKYKTYKWVLKINNTTTIFNTQYFNHLFVTNGIVEITCQVTDFNNNVINTTFSKYIKVI